MDKNFSDILGIFKKLNESADANLNEISPELQKSYAEKAYPDFAKALKDKDEERASKRYKGISNLQKRTHPEQDTDVDEGSMAGAAKHQSGSKFGGYWKGTDKDTPKPGMSVGSMEESLMNEWKQFKEDKFDYETWKQSGSKQKKPRGKHSEKNLLGKGKHGWNKDQKVKEDGAISAVGATGTATGTQNAAKAPNPAQIAQDANKIKQGLTGKLPTGVDANKLSTALATASDVQKPLAGTQAQAVTNTLAPSLAKIAQDPTQANQLGQLIKKAGQQ